MFSEHILTDVEIKALFADIQQTCVNAQDSQSQLDTNTDHSLEACIGTINSAIVPLLQIEICTIVMPEGGVNVRYHGVVNKVADEAAKLYAAPGRTVHEVALFRLLLERIVASGKDMQVNEEEDGKISGVGCAGVVALNDAVGLRLELTGAHRNKLTATQADAAIGSFLRDKWLLQKQSGRQLFLMVGARTYMELPDLLTDLGVERLPQIIVNRR